MSVRTASLFGSDANMIIDRTSSLSVVVCAYTFDRLGDLLDAVGSAARQTTPPSEVVVVVDHNTRLRDALERVAPGDVRVIENIFESGLSGARNTGVAFTTGDLILFLDDDACAHPDCFERLTGCFEDAQVVGAGALIEAVWPNEPPGWFPAEFLWVVGCTYLGLAPGPTRNPLGAAMCIRREVFERTGGFDSALGRTARSSLPLGCEETAFCIRATQAMPGAVFIFLPAARVDHKVTPNRSTWRYLVKRCYAEGLSKARLSSLVGSDQSLAPERSYVFRTLVRGVLRNIGNAIRGDLFGLARSVTIVSGFLAAACGFFVGRTSELFARADVSSNCQRSLGPDTVPVSAKETRSAATFLSAIGIDRLLSANRAFFINVWHLSFGTASASALGFFYWWYAARAFPPSAVGLAAAAISLMNFFGHLGEFGLGALMIGVAHRFEHRANAFIAAALVVGFACSVVLALGYLGLSFALPAELGGTVGGAGFLFVLGCGLTGLTLILDQALVGLLKARLQAVRNVAFAIVKLALLVAAPVVLAASALREQAILATWVLGLYASIALLLTPALFSSRKILVRPDLGMLKPLLPDAIGHHCLNMANLTPSLLLPFLVTVLLTPSTNAAFYAAWTLVNVAFLVPVSLATVAYAVGAQDPTKLAPKLRVSLASSLAVGAGVASVFAVGSNLILGAFSPIYAQIAGPSLQLLGFSLIPVSIKYHYVSVQRIRGRMARASVLAALGCALELGGALVGGRAGDLLYLVIGWLTGLSIEATIMFPVVFSAMAFTRSRREGSPEPAVLAKTVSSK